MERIKDEKREVGVACESKQIKQIKRHKPKNFNRCHGDQPQPPILIPGF
jgi:hypothetical protein